MVTITLTPPPGEWVCYEVDEQTPNGVWRPVAARPVEGVAPATAAVRFSDIASSYRIVWVGAGGSKNMLIGPAQPITAAPGVDRARARRGAIG